MPAAPFGIQFIETVVSTGLAFPQGSHEGKERKGWVTNDSQRQTSLQEEISHRVDNLSDHPAGEACPDHNGGGAGHWPGLLSYPNLLTLCLNLSLMLGSLR